MVPDQTSDRRTGGRCGVDRRSPVRIHGCQIFELT